MLVDILGLKLYWVFYIVDVRVSLLDWHLGYQLSIYGHLLNVVNVIFVVYC